MRLTNIGVRMCGDEIGFLKQIRMGTFEHDKQVVDLSLAMEGKDDFEHFVPERRIRHKLGMKGVVQLGHVPDGHILNSAGERIAIELELTKKQQHRLKKIIRGFQSNLALKEVWYFCAPEVVEHVSKVVAGDELFKIQQWERQNA